MIARREVEKDFLVGEDNNHVLKNAVRASGRASPQRHRSRNILSPAATVQALRRARRRLAPRLAVANFRSGLMMNKKLAAKLIWSLFEQSLSILVSCNHRARGEQLII